MSVSLCGVKNKKLTRVCCSYDVASQLKKAVESETRVSDSLASSAINLDEIKSKMAARVSSYRKVFSGALYPDSVLVSHSLSDRRWSSHVCLHCLVGWQQRLQADAGWDKAKVLERQERGRLESFEALVRLSGCLSEGDDTSNVLESLRGTAARIREDTASEEACNPLERQIDRFIKRFSSKV